MLIQHTLDIARQFLDLAPPGPTPTTTPPADPGGDIIHTDQIIGAAAKFIVPLLMCLVGVWIMGRARRGRVSEVVTTSGISLWGIAFIAGATLFFAVGDKIVHLFIG